jgi:RNase P/RNase MRP subunit p29
MKAKISVLTLALCFLAGAVCFASDSQMGTWKLNEAKSKLAAGMPKNSTIVFEASGDSIKVTIDGTDSAGKPTHNEWTGKLDGKDYPVTGDPNSDARSYKQVDDHTLEFSIKKGGKVTISGRVVVSADGKTRTATANGTDPQGKTFKSTSVYDK